MSPFPLTLIASLLSCDPGPSAAAPPPPPPPLPPPVLTPVPSPPLAYLEAGRPDAAVTIVALHGLGDTPERFVRLLEGTSLDARIVVPAAPLPYGQGFSWFDYTPEQPHQMTAGLLLAAAQVADLIDALSLPEPPLVTGFSQGGMISFVLAVRYPERIQAALPIGGALPTDLWPSTPVRVAPILALHGEADTRVAWAPTKAAIDQLQRLGLPAQLRGYPDVGHTIPLSMRQDLVAALTALSAPCSALLTPTPQGTDVQIPFTLASGAPGGLTLGSLLRPLPEMLLGCAAGQQGVQVVSENFLYRAPHGGAVVEEGMAGCVAYARLQTVSTLIPRPLRPGEAAQVAAGAVIHAEGCAVEGVTQLRPATPEMVAAVQTVRAAWTDAFGEEAPAVGVSEWGYAHLPLSALGEAEIAAERAAERLETAAQQEKVTTGLGPLRDDGVPVYSHFTGADAPYSDAWGRPAALVTWLRLAADWAARCPAEGRACTLQIGDLAWYNGRRPDPLGHETHSEGMCMDVRLFREDGSRYEAFWNQPDDRPGVSGGYSPALTLAFLQEAVAHHPLDVVYFNDPAAHALAGVRAYPQHDDHIHLCVRSDAVPTERESGVRGGGR